MATVLSVGWTTIAKNDQILIFQHMEQESINSTKAKPWRCFVGPNEPIYRKISPGRNLFAFSLHELLNLSKMFCTKCLPCIALKYSEIFESYDLIEADWGDIDEI